MASAASISACPWADDAVGATGVHGEIRTAIDEQAQHIAGAADEPGLGHNPLDVAVVGIDRVDPRGQGKGRRDGEGRRVGYAHIVIHPVEDEGLIQQAGAEVGAVEQHAVVAADGIRGIAVRLPPGDLAGGRNDAGLGLDGTLEGTDVALRTLTRAGAVEIVTGVGEITDGLFEGASAVLVQSLPVPSVLHCLAPGGVTELSGPAMATITLAE